MKSVVKRLGFCAVTLALVCASTLNSVHVFAEDEEGHNAYLQSKIISTDGVPDGLHLVVRDAYLNNRFEEYEDYFAFLFGEEGRQAMSNVMQELEGGDYEEGSEEYMKLIVGFYEQIGVIDLDDALDFHLEDEGNNKIPYSSGDGVTISYDYDIDILNDDDGNDFVEFLRYSSKEWKPMIIHIKDDDTIEYLPATIDGGVWTFTVKDFSAFIPAFVVVEEEAPKTLDDMTAHVGFIAVSLATFALIGVHICKNRR